MTTFVTNTSLLLHKFDIVISINMSCNLLTYDYFFGSVGFIEFVTYSVSFKLNNVIEIRYCNVK